MPNVQMSNVPAFNGTPPPPPTTLTGDLPPAGPNVDRLADGGFAHTLGRVKPGAAFTPDDADPRFVDAVRRVLPRLRFHPAAVGARRVRQLVEQLFALAR